MHAFIDFITPSGRALRTRNSPVKSSPSSSHPISAKPAKKNSKARKRNAPKFNQSDDDEEAELDEEEEEEQSPKPKKKKPRVTTKEPKPNIPPKDEVKIIQNDYMKEIALLKAELKNMKEKLICNTIQSTAAPTRVHCVLMCLLSSFMTD